jgi:hypothetical protein
MEIVQWIKDHEPQIGVTFTRFHDQIDITMYTYKTKLYNRITLDYYELNDMNSEKIINILNLIYDELSRGNIND